MEEQLGDLLARVEEQYGRQSSAEQDDDDEEEEEGYLTEAEPEEEAVVIDRSRIEELFTQAAKDRSKAFELEARTRPPRPLQGVRGPLPRPVPEVRVSRPMY